MKQILAITRKEINSYFSSPMALIFVGVFLAATLFTFFWMETFFARGVSDVRPMFKWMPMLLLFLVSALTMRQWSEEQQTNTLEILLTLPVNGVQLVIGKFLAVLDLVIVALALTLPLPISVSLMGNLDWGPVIGGYLAAILMASAYIALGLFISSLTDNQIVSLILTLLVGGILYMVGATPVTDFFGQRIAEILHAFGTGSRFESIERGVIDLRDLVYYLSLTVMFLTLNVIALDSKRWSLGENTLSYRQNMVTSAVLIGANLLLLNLWLFPFTQIRFDLTAQKEYSLSPATYDMVSNLQEPLLIRAYLSDKTHPLLAPLAPQVRDVLREYEIASKGMVTSEVIDPPADPEKEAEANQTYGIQPTPLQAADRYGASVVNAYFDILVRYGDQNVVLNFRDLIEIEPNRTGQIDVRLRNLEYDLTKAIKKVVYGFQSIDAVLASMSEPVQLTLFVTPADLPEPVATAPDTIAQVAGDIETKSNGKFTFDVVDLDDPNSTINRQTLQEQGVRPIPVDIFGQQTFYMHMLLQIGDEGQWLFPSGDLSEADIRTTIESALKRSTDGFLKVVGIWTPPPAPQANPFGQPPPSLKKYQVIQEKLRADYTVKPVDFANGQVPLDVDVLLVISPQNMSDSARYAIDQYLMRGGSLIVLAGNYGLMADQFTGGLGVEQMQGSLKEMLESYGFTVEEAMVLDPQNEPFPQQIQRDVGGFQVMEIQAIDYPFFVDVRSDGMDKNSPVLANLQSVTLNWSSPITINETKNADRSVDILLRSTDGAWLQTDTNIQPDFKLYPDYGFEIQGEQESRILAVAAQGVFESFFKGKEIPTPEPDPNQQPGQPPVEPPATNNIGTIESSPETARLVIIGSAEFINDIVFDISSNLTRDRYLNSLQFAENTVDWTVEDLDLLTIRSRGSSVRLLNPETEKDKTFWEGLNYGLAFLGIIAIGVVWRMRQQSEQPMELLPPADFAEV